MVVEGSCLDRIKVYVNSIEPSACHYVDMHSLEHPCSQAGESAFEGLRHLPARSSGFLSDNETEAINLVEQFSRQKGLEFETVDLRNAGLIAKMKFYLKGWKTPAIVFRGRTITGLPTREELKALLSE